MSAILDYSTLCVSVASMLISAVAAIYSKSSVSVSNESLKLAKEVADSAHKEWRQRQWVDLYREADHAYDLLDRLQRLYDGQIHESREYEDAYNDVMLQFRRAHALAAVFPVSPPIDALFQASAVFSDRSEARSQTRLDAIFSAVNGIREQALLDGSVLS